MTSETAVPIRPFPQITTRGLLPANFMKATYSRFTNNEFFFKLLNRDFVQDFDRLQRPKLDDSGARIVDDLKANGIAFATVAELFECDLFDKIKSSFEQYAEKFAKRKVIANSQVKGKEIFLDTIHKSHTFEAGDIVSYFLAAPQLAAIAAEYMELVPRYVGSSFWHTRPAPSGERLHSQLWHRDYNDRRVLKVFLYLSDVGAKNGYFEYVSGSQFSGPLGREFDTIGSDGYRAYPDQNSIQKVLAQTPVIELQSVPPGQTSGACAPWHEKIARIRCTSSRGALIFCDTFGLHRGGFVEEGYRDMIMTTFSTNFNVHKPHFAVSPQFAATLTPFMKMVFGVN